ncbi:extracellular solute-binding protein [Metabacillus sp. GX 13764]|uniref:ABC transporter substrate-binding protein n=1 Tax=Metabacillus kandeliae TaxID=2900151 RepID=UPI001E40188F|nr:extracellular solute-binding protein [Metabacillus kandeliae]MCD7034110.1 extracellular solute-binding protein [Metabacillus kandeliae]
MKKALAVLVAGSLTLAGLSGCSSQGTSADGKVKIEFFQYKPEAKGTFDKLIEKFEKENPKIDVVQSNPPDAETVLKTRMAKRDLPDVVAMGGNSSFSELSHAGAFEDMSKDKNLKDIKPAYVQMLKDITGLKEVYGIPYAANADAVIYNKTIFKELGLEVPKTWDEFISTAEKVKAAGKIPFYFTFKDAWTTLPSYNVLAANTEGDSFFKDLNSGSTAFKNGHKEAVEKFLTLINYGHKDQNGKAYNDGNTAFAKGDSAMYLQGIWAIPEIKKANPNIDLGVFPYPVTNTPGESKVVSGVDLLLALSSNTKHKAEAEKWINFLTSDATAKEYLKEQNAFSAKNNVTQDDPSLEGLKETFAKGAVTDFPDHYVPIAVGLEKQLQVLAMNKNADQYLKKLDTEWNKVKDRK